MSASFQEGIKNCDMEALRTTLARGGMHPADIEGTVKKIENLREVIKTKGGLSIGDFGEMLKSKYNRKLGYKGRF